MKLQRRTWLFLLTLLAALAVTPSAFAEDPPPMFRGINPSAGTRMAAMLETVGYRAQSLVLDDLDKLFGSFAIFIWIAAAIMALTSYALYRRADGLLWMLIAPPFFYMIMNDRTENRGVEWQMGDYSRTYEVLAQLPAGNMNSKVSWLFDRYNSIISQLSRTMISVVMDRDAREVMTKFMAREHILTDLVSMRIQDGGLQAFLADSLMTCNTEMDAARIVSIGQRDAAYRSTAEYNHAQKVYQLGYSSETKQLSMNASRNYLGQLFHALQDNGGAFPGILDAAPAYSACPGMTLAKIGANPGGIDAVVSEPVSCEQLWCWMGLGLQAEVTHRATQIQESSGLDDATYRELLHDIAVKLTTPIVEVDANGNPYQGGGTVNQDLSLIPVIIGGLLIRQTMQEGTHMRLMEQFSAHTGISRQTAPFDSSDPSWASDQQARIVQRNIAQQVTEQNKFDLYTFAMVAPYIQGVILYALALSFPFFALLVLIPSRMGTFLLWFKLWAWAKSWDIGWALVMLIDGLLWQMLPHSVVYDQLRDPNFSPITVFDAAFDGDPSYSLATYYVILALLITSVPFFTAKVFLGVNAGVTQGITNSMQSFSRGLAQRAWMPSAISSDARLNWLRTKSEVNQTMARQNTPASMNGDPMVKQLNDTVAGFRTEAGRLMRQPTGTTGSFVNPTSDATITMTNTQAAGFLLRQANMLDARIKGMNAQINLSQVGQTDAVQSPMAVAGATIGRVQWWTIQGAATDALISADHMYYQMRRADARSFAQSEGMGVAAPF